MIFVRQALTRWILELICTKLELPEDEPRREGFDQGAAVSRLNGIVVRRNNVTDFVG